MRVARPLGFAQAKQRLVLAIICALLINITWIILHYDGHSDEPGHPVQMAVETMAQYVPQKALDDRVQCLCICLSGCLSWRLVLTVLTTQLTRQLCQCSQAETRRQNKKAEQEGTPDLHPKSHCPATKLHHLVRSQMPALVGVSGCYWCQQGLQAYLICSPVFIPLVSMAHAGAHHRPQTELCLFEVCLPGCCWFRQGLQAQHCSPV